MVGRTIYNREIDGFETLLDHHLIRPPAADPRSGFLHLGSQFDSGRGFQVQRRSPRAVDPQPGLLSLALRFDSESGFHRLWAGSQAVWQRAFNSHTVSSTLTRPTSRVGEKRGLVTQFWQSTRPLPGKFGVRFPASPPYAGVAQLAEQCFRKAPAVGSTPAPSSMEFAAHGLRFVSDKGGCGSWMSDKPV